MPVFISSYSILYSFSGQASRQPSVRCDQIFRRFQLEKKYRLFVAVHRFKGFPLPFCFRRDLRQGSGVLGIGFGVQPWYCGDLILRRERRTLAFELKSSSVPRVSKGFWNALEDISPDEAYVVAPVKESYPMKGDVMVSPLQEIIAKLQEE